MTVTVRDVRRHLPPVEGKAVSDWQVHCFLMMHRAMRDAEAEEQDRQERTSPDADIMDNQG